jgi:pyruvate dehydrogenase E2 component (dihydrolipoamide acetyltransferase)
MDVEIKMPDLATTDDSVTLLRWLIAVGQPVKRGQPLFEIETDKATMDVESVAEGVLASVHAEPGSQIPIGQVVAVVSSTEQAGAAPALQKTEPPPAPVVVTPSAPPVSPVMAPARPSLFARNRAARQGTPVPAEAPAEETSIALTTAQRTTARRLQQASQVVPHFYLTLSANAEPMAAARAASDELVWDAFFVRAIAQAAADFERMRCRFEDDRLVPIASDAVGVAADVDDDLYVIPIENPLALSLRGISDRIKRQVALIRQGDAPARRLGRTYLTISNLGGAGIESFAPIINPPEPAILGIGQIAPVPHVQDGQIIIQRRVTLTLAVDHRVASGKYAAAFLQRIVSELEAIS